MSRRNRIKIESPKGVQSHRPWYQIHNKATGDKETRIDILENIGFWGVTAKNFRDDIGRLGKDEALHIHINSDGGEVIEGNEIFNILMEHDGPIRVSIGAMAASIASVIAMAGDEISIAKNGFLMIHNPFTIVMGDSEECRKAADTMDKMKNGIIQAYKRHCDLSEKEISDLMDDETYMDAEEAVENGFAGKVDDFESDEGMENMNLSRFMNSAQFLKRPEVAQLLSKGGNQRQEQAGKPEPAAEGAQNSRETSRKTIGVVIRNEMKPETQNAPAAPADPEAVEKQAKAMADKLYAERLKSDQEIDDIVIAVRGRDKKDFGDLAAKFKRDQKTPDEFARAIATSDDFKEFEVIGAGIEVIEPLDNLKGSPGFCFVTSEAYKALAENIRNRGRGSSPKNLLERVDLPITVRDYMNGAVRQAMNVAGEPTSAGLTSIEKFPGMIQLGVRPLMVKDLIAPGATTNTTIRYIREVSFTNYATTVAEGAAKPEALFEYAEVDAPVRKIAAYTKVTDELFADYLAVASYINQRLPYMVERTEEDQILNGDGIAPNLTGILQTAGIQTQAKGADSAADAIYKAMTKIRFTGFFEPDGIVIHPNDFQDIRLLKDGNNQYYGGGPFTGAYGNSPLVQFDSLWGKPCAITPAITEGTALVGAFRLGAQYFQRQGLTIEMTNSDQDDFIKNRMTIRCEERLALAVYRALAFCTVTGI
jgi:HK97 family phage major capsid protein